MCSLVLLSCAARNGLSKDDLSRAGLSSVSRSRASLSRAGFSKAGLLRDNISKSDLSPHKSRLEDNRNRSLALKRREHRTEAEHMPGS